MPRRCMCNELEQMVLQPVTTKVRVELPVVPLITDVDVRLNQATMMKMVCQNDGAFRYRRKTVE